MKKVCWICTILCLSIMLIISGCSAGKSAAVTDNGVGGSFAYDEVAAKEVEMMPTEAAAPDPSVPSDAQVLTKDRKIIYSASMQIRAKDVAGTYDAIKKDVADFGGYVSQSSFYSYEENDPSGEIVLRVPSDRLESCMDHIASLAGQVVSRDLTSDEVTEEYYDLDARIALLKEQQKELERLMNETGSVEELLSVQEKLFQLQETLESYEGRMRYLNDRISDSVLTVDISSMQALVSSNKESMQYMTAGELGKGMMRGLDNSWRILINIGGFLLIALCYCAVPAAVILLIVWFVRRLVKKRKKKKLQKKASTQQEQ